MSPVETVDTVDDRTVRFQLEQPYPAIEHALTYPIIPKAVREEDREAFARDPIGAGPYRVRSFSEEKKAQLVRWEDYWGEPAPAIDRVVFAYVESPITQLMGLVTGQSDAIEPISPRYRQEITSLTDATVAERPGFRSFFFGFNCNAFAVLGSLEAVVEFASLAFIVVFGTVSALAFVNRDGTDIRTLPPVVGMVGSASFFVMLLYFLFTRLPHVFYLVIIIAVAVFTVEAAYFKRDSIKEGIREVETEI